ncbi:hypothetical protein LVB77_14590 [Lysobacter sp. 5GHs7-4]|uniref:hypothetical protein n=1 Tax=Lysobacter sp. 5GHs7-4 TaxID=2904253 RepID=UPI001E36D2CA|nr:hypothetical protein [Lysobacter sp. 5GHs7-4]UHQ21894.1 hypothetical protein LVB77_14590 [Lysobacter sp. 5GHs7-4]
MNLLVTGKGGAGSWTVRGEQLGTALGATVRPNASRQDIEQCDLAVVVKRTPEPLIAALRAARRPWVLDVVDFYPQPLASQWRRAEAIRWVRRRIADLAPTALIWPNQQMADDCGIDLPSVVLYHHHRPGIDPNPIRAQVGTVGYEGAPAYLAEWQPVLEAECRRRGWRFLVNPPRLADLDIVIALRGGQWSGYVPAHWKSNVKLANAHGSSTPFIGQAECGYRETAVGGERFVSTPADLREALDALTPHAARLAAHRRFATGRYQVEDAAADLRRFLHAL